jgi:hypothetical protein
VVLFGGFIPPQVTGYPTHTNLTAGSAACGKLQSCSHCRAAMDAISVEKVMKSALARLELQRCGSRLKQASSSIWIAR